MAGGTTGGAAAGGGVLAVDTVELDELAHRLQRAGTELSDVAAGVPGLQGLGALAVGADAVADALSDLVRQWSGAAEVLAADTEGVGLAVAGARRSYESCEDRVVGMVCVRGDRGEAR